MYIAKKSCKVGLQVYGTLKHKGLAWETNAGRIGAPEGRENVNSREPA